MVRKAEYICIFLAGGVIYSLIEMLWRGFTHWSMILAGGVCVLLIHCFNQRLRKRNVAFRCGIGCAVITAVEFAVGVLVNLVLGWNVWDYSAMYGNVLGQICPAFSCMWFLISFPACGFSSLARRFFDSIEENETKVPTV